MLHFLRSKPQTQTIQIDIFPCTLHSPFDTHLISCFCFPCNFLLTLSWSTSWIHHPLKVNKLSREMVFCLRPIRNVSGTVTAHAHVNSEEVWEWSLSWTHGNRKSESGYIRKQKQIYLQCVNASAQYARLGGLQVINLRRENRVCKMIYK